jgi:hypothetical protein
MIIQLFGNLANQMFQYAFGRSVSLERKEKAKFKFKDERFNYRLNVFDISIDTVSSAENIPTYQENSFSFNHQVYVVPGEHFFVGYWQTERYFNPGLVRGIFSINETISEEGKKLAFEIRTLKERSAFIHVRRGDYLSLSNLHLNLTEDYYRAGIEYIQNKVPGVKFFVFSDDPGWCQKTFPQFKVVYHSGLNVDHENIWLMSLCRHGIIANSSFSWWGAWIGDFQEDRIIIAPGQWFGPGNSHLDASDIVPTRWIKLDKNLTLPERSKNDVLIAVLSCHKNWGVHPVIRSTWGEKIRDADVRFFIGRPKKQIAEDEVFLDVEDDYDSLPYKTHAMVKWALEHGYKYIFKVDTDTFVVPSRLFASKYTQHSYVGYPWPKEERSGGFQWASGGAGYWINWEAMEVIARHPVEEFCWYKGKIQPEDMAVGRVLGEHGILIQHDMRYCPEVVDRYPRPDNNFITTHRCNPEKLIFLHKVMSQELPGSPKFDIFIPQSELGPVVMRDGKKVQLDRKGVPIKEIYSPRILPSMP